MSETNEHPLLKTIKELTGEDIEAIKPGINYELTNWVEWVVAHKGCGKPMTGSSPRNGWCNCSYKTGLSPEVKGWSDEQSKVDVDETHILRTRCETAEKEVVKLTEKLDKASKRISELVKNQKHDSK